MMGAELFAETTAVPLQIAAAWLLTYGAHSTILVGVAWLAGRWRGTPLPLLDLLWKTALVGGVVTATAQVGLSVLGSRGAPPGGPPEASGPVAAVGLSALAAGLVALWLVASGTATVRLLLRRRQLKAYLGDRQDVCEGPIPEVVERLRRTLGLRRPVRVSASERVRTPAAIGRAEVCLPLCVFARLSPVQQESVLAHELAHLRRRDPLWLIIADAVCAAFPFQPLNRVARRELREAAEFLCDGAAAAHTAPTALAEGLHVLAAHLLGRPESALVGFAATESALMRRVRRVLESSRHAGRYTSGRWEGAFVVAGAVLVTSIMPRVPAPSLPSLSSDVEIVVVGATVDMDGHVTEVRPGGYVRVTERRVGLPRLAEVHRSRERGLRYAFKENGQASPPSPSAMSWLEGLLRRE